MNTCTQHLYIGTYTDIYTTMHRCAHVCIYIYIYKQTQYKNTQNKCYLQFLTTPLSQGQDFAGSSECSALMTKPCCTARVLVLFVIHPYPFSSSCLKLLLARWKRYSPQQPSVHILGDYTPPPSAVLFPRPAPPLPHCIRQLASV